MFARNEFEEGAFWDQRWRQRCGLRISVPSARATPQAVPSSTIMWSIVAPVCSVAPRTRADAANACVTPPHSALDNAVIFGFGKVAAFDIGVSPRAPRRGDVTGILRLGIRAPPSPPTQKNSVSRSFMLTVRSRSSNASSSVPRTRSAIWLSVGGVVRKYG